MAARHDRLGLAVGDRVAFVSHNSARLFTAFFGVCGYGRVLVPVNFRLSFDEVQYIVDHSGARVVYVDPELKDAARRAARPSTSSGSATTTTSTSRTSSRSAWEPDENATATINYTSGTTARPKGVQITHRNIWTNAVTFALHAGVTDRDVYLHTLPMFHANGWGMPFAMTGCGVPQVALRKVDGAEILRRVEKYGVTVMCAAPAVVAAVLDAAPELGRARSPAATGPGSSSPAPRRRRRRSRGSRPSWAGSSSRSTGSPRPRRCSPSTAGAQEWDDLDPEDRAPEAGPRRHARRSASASRSTDEGEVLARSNVVPRGLLGAAGGDRRRRWPAAGSTPATAASSTTRATSRSRTARRT